MSSFKSTDRSAIVVALLAAAVISAYLWIGHLNVLPPLPIVPGLADADREAARPLYEFAALHPRILESRTCPCGCKAIDHATLRDCFIVGSVSGFTRQVHWNAHALTCDACLSLARAAMQQFRNASS